MPERRKPAPVPLDRGLYYRWLDGSIVCMEEAGRMAVLLSTLLQWKEVGSVVKV